MGLLATATLGEWLVSLVIGAVGVGIDRLHFMTNPGLALVAHPVLLVGVAMLAAVLMTRSLTRSDRSTWLR